MSASSAITHYFANAVSILSSGCRICIKRQTGMPKTCFPRRTAVACRWKASLMRGNDLHQAMLLSLTGEHSDSQPPEVSESTDTDAREFLFTDPATFLGTVQLLVFKNLSLSAKGGF